MRASEPGPSGVDQSPSDEMGPRHRSEGEDNLWPTG